MAAILNKIFRRRKQIPLACTMLLETDPNHIHTASCFLDIQPLSIVELFSSQSCISCPPTTPKILQATTDPNLLLLSYGVTYFDNLGWVDTFGDKKWDNRQRLYLQRWRRTSIFTPNVIADGLSDGTGAGVNEVQEIVSRARIMRRQMPWHIIVDTNEEELRIDSEGVDVGMFDIFLIRYDPKTQVVKVGKGPNKRKKITYKNQVKDIIRIGQWSGGNLTIGMPRMAKTGLEIVAVVQGAMGGPIVAAQKVEALPMYSVEP